MRAALLLLALVAGCRTEPSFACTTDPDCSGGTCIAGGCAFPDGACSSGKRWDSTSPVSPSACVPPADMVVICGGAGQHCCGFGCDVGLICAFDSASCAPNLGTCHERAAAVSMSLWCDDGSSCGPCM